MKIIALMGQRKPEYGGDHTPELLEAWDEYAIDSNREGWEEAKKARLKSVNADKEMFAVREFAIEVDEDEIHRHLIGLPEIKSQVTPFS